MNGGGNDVRNEEGGRKVDAALGTTDDGDKGESGGTDGCDKKRSTGDPAWKVAKGYVSVVENLVGDTGSGACSAVKDDEEY